MSQLKLGPFPKIEMVRVTVTIPKPLKQALDLYAAEFSKAHGPAETHELIPHMLEAFLRSDKTFMKSHAKRVGGGASKSPRPLPGTSIATPEESAS
jgi:hypothetical protein